MERWPPEATVNEDGTGNVLKVEVVRRESELNTTSLPVHCGVPSVNGLFFVCFWIVAVNQGLTVNHP